MEGWHMVAPSTKNQSREVTNIKEPSLASLVECRCNEHWQHLCLVEKKIQWFNAVQILSIKSNAELVAPLNACSKLSGRKQETHIVCTNLAKLWVVKVFRVLKASKLRLWRCNKEPSSARSPVPGQQSHLALSPKSTKSYKICANVYRFAALKRRLAMVVGGILRHVSSQTSGSASVDLLVKTSHSKSCELRNLRVLRILADVIDLPQVSPIAVPKKHWECWGAIVLEVSLEGCPHDLPLNWLETIDHWRNRPQDLPSAHRQKTKMKGNERYEVCRYLANCTYSYI